MRHFQNITVCLAVLITTGLTVLAQETREEDNRLPQVRIEILARSYGDSIVLRWAPTTAAAWYLGNHNGYVVERSYVGADSVTVREQLTPLPLKPWDLQRMMDYFGPSDTLAAIAAEVIHGEGFAPADVSGEGDHFIDALVNEYERQQNGFAFALQAAEFDQKVAEAIGLRFCDRNVVKDRLYLYVVRSMIPPDVLDINPGSAILYNEPFTPLEAPEGIDIRQTSNRIVEFVWARNQYTGFYVERSMDNGRNWQLLNEKPYYSSEPDDQMTFEPGSANEFYTMLLHTHHVYFDSIVPGNTYQYRVQGLDAFTDLSLFSEPVTISPIDLEPPVAPLINSPVTLENQTIRVSWSMNLKEPDLAGFRVQKAPLPDGPWTDLHPSLLPVGASEFVDKQAGNTNGGYYMVIAEDKSGNQSASMPAKGIVEDKEPPAVPTGLKGMVFLDGIVTLFWDESKEPDLRGYRVYYANQDDHTYITRTPRPIDEAFFTDTIPVKSLTRGIYYKVLAEDQSGNMSELTPALALGRPDVVPPAAPVTYKASQTAETVSITWSRSASEDVVAYRIFRKPKNAPTWDLLKMVDPKTLSGHILFTDSPPASPQPYEYTVEAIDSWGNSSGMAKPVSFRIRGKRTVDVPITLSGSAVAGTGGVKLSWGYPQQADHKIEISRAVNSDVLAVLTTSESSASEFTDRRVEPGTMVRYSVRLVFSDGRYSQPSEVITVRVH
jgi:fibronectin type 3 domain-containing protein